MISYTACSLRSSNKRIRFLVAVEAVEKVCRENVPDLSPLNQMLPESISYDQKLQSSIRVSPVSVLMAAITV